MVFPSVSMDLFPILLVNGFLLVSGPIQFTVWDWVRTNLGISDGILDLRDVCYVRFLV
jgi:hypothetical protein